MNERDVSEFPPFARRHWWVVAVQSLIAVIVLCGALAVFNRSSGVLMLVVSFVSRA